MTFSSIRDVLAATAILILTLGAVFVLIPMGVQVPGSVKSAALSPAFWPRIIGFGAIAASVFMVIETLTMRQPTLNLTAEEETIADLGHSTAFGNLRAVVLTAALFGFYFSLTTLGIPLACVLLMAAMMLYFGESNRLLVVGLSVSIPILLFLFFRYVAGVPIPLGIFAN